MDDLITYLASWLTDKLLTSQKRSEYGKVQLPKLYAIFGATAFVSCQIASLLSAYLGEPIWFCVLIFLLSAIGVAIMIAYINCRITYDEEGFVSKTFWGRKRAFTYEQVTAVKEDSHLKIIYLGEKRIMIDGFAIGGPEFIELVKKRCQTIQAHP